MAQPTVILDSLRDQLCLIDKFGNIVFANQAWINAALSNGGDIQRCGVGANYLEACKEEKEIYSGISSILSNKVDYFSCEYPCHTPTTNKWFYMQATPCNVDRNSFEGAVIWHVDITEKKLLEMKLKEYAVTDPLTSLYNRRFFDQKLKSGLCLRRQARELIVGLRDGDMITIDSDPGNWQWHYRKTNWPPRGGAAKV
ncbi:sensor domain-containing diguanylate cyclase [Paenibacillus cymbidii]|uniref:sensor domain-containing diguanylate cyclase n=1 Tax=Paenibacillus cymbidii TaxID=1639034 RepID=UPI001080A640|nr:hypothetical protein [Paenibacillus cymbidii]